MKFVSCVGRWSISTRILLFQTAFVVILTGSATTLLAAQAQADTESDVAERTMMVATAIADNPFVVAALADADPSALLQPYALDVMRDTSTDFVTITNPDRTRYTHPNQAQIGHRFQGTTAPALRGVPFTETYSGTLGPSVRSVVPIRQADDSMVGMVSVGVTVRNLSAALSGRLWILCGAAVITAALGLLLSWQLGRFLRRVTWGRAPDEMSQMFAYYQGVLHTVREGLVLVDTRGRVVLYNDQAAELLRLAPRPASAPPLSLAVEGLGLPDSLRALLAGGSVAVDQMHIIDDAVLVVNQSRAVSTDAAGRSRLLGTITTFRDQTDVYTLSGELYSMRALSDALRCQTPEYSNRLHTIIALIELGRADEALTFAAREVDTHRDQVNEIGDGIDEPVLAALLRGKAASASERGVDVTLDVDADVRAANIPAQTWVTIIGNLIDNAVDAVAPAIDGMSGVINPAIRVQIEMADDALRIRVSDNGVGVREPKRIFHRGYSTKTHNGRGIGLSLVAQAVQQLGGTIDVANSESETGATGAIFRIVIPVPVAAASVAA